MSAVSVADNGPAVRTSALTRSSVGTVGLEEAAITEAAAKEERAREREAAAGIR